MSDHFNVKSEDRRDTPSNQMLLLIEHQLQLSDEKQVKKQQQTRLHLKEIIATGDIELAKMRLN